MEVEPLYGIEPMYYVQNIDDLNEENYAYWHVTESIVHPHIERASKYTKKEALYLCSDYESVAFPCHLIDEIKDKSKDIVLLKDLHKPISKQNKKI